MKVTKSEMVIKNYLLEFSSEEVALLRDTLKAYCYLRSYGYQAGTEGTLQMANKVIQEIDNCEKGNT